jgi:phage terminase large subunit-like protein
LVPYGGLREDKTRSAAQLVKRLLESGTAKPLGMVVPTATNVRDVMVNGKSGILTVNWPDFMAAD